MIWYEEEVQYLEKKAQIQENTLPKVIFYGSSSIRLWTSLQEDFKVNLVNIGFGGSTLAACVWFFERLVLPYKPSSMIVYAGDNDLGDGRNPEEVFIFFQQLLYKIRQHFGDIPLGFISIKPSFMRWTMKDKIRYTNQLIRQEIEKSPSNQYFINIYEAMLDERGFPNKDYFDADGLHLSPKGYEIWKNEVLKFSSRLF
jgi:lysophospholipase L1-like esterase